MSDDTAIKDWVCEVLNELGLTAKPVPVADGQRTPDLEATDGKHSFLFEIKTKMDDPATITSDAKRVHEGESVVRSTAIDHNNNLSAIVRDAADQLQLPQPLEAIRLLWLIAGGSEPVRQKEQVYATLYGVRQVADSTARETRPCFYFDFNEFFKLQGMLDGAIVCWPENGVTKVELFVNSHSAYVEEIRDSALYKNLPDGVCDPEILEREEVAYLADTNIDRRNSDAVLDYIRDKYKNPNLFAFPAMSYITGTVPFQNH